MSKYLEMSGERHSYSKEAEDRANHKVTAPQMRVVLEGIKKIDLWRMKQ